MNDSMHPTALDAPSSAPEAAVQETPAPAPEGAAPQTPALVHEAASSPPSAGEGDATQANQQRAYLLRQLADAPGRKLARGIANRKIPKAVKEKLGLDNATADRLREALAVERYIRITKKGQTVTSELTDEGGEFLKTLAAAVGERGTNPQRALLLQQLAEAPGRKLLQGEANAKINKATTTALNLDKQKANEIRETLAAQGHIRLARENRKITYELTDQGAAHLRTLPPLLPPGYNPPSNTDVEAMRNWYLLWKTLKEETQASSSKRANSSDAMGKALELNAPTVAYLRRGLLIEGLLTSHKQDRTETYTLTPQGWARLGASSFPAGRSFTLRGEVLNRLLDAARDAAREFVPSAPVHEPAVEERPAPRPEALAEAVWDAFEELRREKYQRSGLTPIYEVRQVIREKYGDKAASHAVLDEVIRELWRAKRVRLTPITDRAKATSQELDNSIQGVGETLFYLEPAHEHAVL